MGVTVERPRTEAAIKALIRKRRRNISRLEQALAISLPAQDRRHLEQRLAGERANMQSWIDHLERKSK